MLAGRCGLAWQLAESGQCLVMMAVKEDRQALAQQGPVEVALCQLTLRNWVLASTPAGSTPRPAVGHPSPPQHLPLLAGGPASYPLSS